MFTVFLNFGSTFTNRSGVLSELLALNFSMYHFAFIFDTITVQNHIDTFISVVN
jgi:hypothetical protein